MAKGWDVWMALYIGAYLSDTMHLTREQHGSYLLLIMAAFKNEGWLPNDDPFLAQVAKCTADQWKAERAIYARFFDVGDERWTHKRATAEADRAKSLTADRSKAGSKGAAKRWQSHKQTDGQVQSQVQSPVTTTDRVERKKRASAQKTQIPKDFKATPEQLEYARAQGCSDPTDTAERFYLHHAGKGTLHADWDLAFKYWCRNEKNFRRASPTKPTLHTLAEPTANDWKGRVDWFRTKGMWNPLWGPPPDQPGCFAPKEFLQ